MRSRSEIYALTDTELQVAVDGVRLRLTRSWERNEPGSVTAIYDLALLTSEAQVRGIILRPLRDTNQMSLLDMP